MNNYEDIINLPHHVSTKRPQMPLKDRAAQFAPFAALTGHDEVIKETARLTDERIELDENALAILNEKIQIILDNLDMESVVTATYFKPDNKKSGGAYIDHTGVVKRIDNLEKTIIFTDKKSIPIKDILEIKSSLITKKCLINICTLIYKFCNSRQQHKTSQQNANNRSSCVFTLSSCDN